MTNDLYGPTHHVDADMLQRLRALRLYHWQGVVTRRLYASGKGLTPAYRDAENAAADEHLRHVQTLNNFFAIGDTAEGDAAK